MSKTIGVVLAAGRGIRLRPHVPEFHKPLLTVNGRTIVAQAVEALYDIVDTVVVVVAPANAQQVVGVTSHIGADIQYVVQPEPNGPGDAIDRALSFATINDRFIVVMGDNVLGRNDLRNLLESDGSGIIVGTQELAVGATERFTRIGPGGIWIEGPYLPEEHRMKGTVQTVWLGPIIMPVSAWVRNSANCHVLGEHKISPIFRLSPTTIVRCDTTDVGEVGTF